MDQDPGRTPGLSHCLFPPCRGSASIRAALRCPRDPGWSVVCRRHGPSARLAGLSHTGVREAGSGARPRDDRRRAWGRVSPQHTAPRGAVLKDEATRAEMHVGLPPSSRRRGRSALRSQNSGPRQVPVGLQALTRLRSHPVATGRSVGASWGRKDCGMLGAEPERGSPPFREMMTRTLVLPRSSSP